ncbi:hypothetical protein [Mahella sp.]|uniref:hypothetical protein n=1 Tax=Mahella sp. TaxID=2798721 RepID=UPI0025C140AC|nr:hypothetical protein [Mahella sp.]MBZ4665405.1 cell division protein FtsQ [Mahella sp.]
MERVLRPERKNSSKDLMLFILVLALSGIENLIAEVLPEFQLGPIEVGISSFIFVPIVLCILFDSFWAALAAPIGELVFADLILGEFGGLGEFEEVILLTMGLYIAGKMVKDVTNRKQIAAAALFAFIFQDLIGTFIDMTKVWVGIEDFEAISGLPESVFALEMIDFLVEFAVTGIIFGLIPTLYFAPRLYGKIEPLLGIKPRLIEKGAALNVPIRLIGGAIIAVIAAAAVSMLSGAGFNIIEWEPEFLDQFGQWYIWVPITIAAIVAIVVIWLGKSNNGEGQDINV